MISALTFLRANVTDVFQISYSGLGPTEMRVATALLSALIYFRPPAAFDFAGVVLKYPDVTALAWCLTAFISFLACMIMQVRQLALEEPRRRGELSIREAAERARLSQSGANGAGDALAAGQTGAQTAGGI
jgi:hypothetical protein